MDDAAQVLATFMMIKTFGYMTAGATAIWLAGCLRPVSASCWRSSSRIFWLSLAVLQIFVRAAVLPHTVATVLRLSGRSPG
ncbi:MAG: hypothetical protein R2838_25380 [Caldilineaceae bacterium]